MKPAYLIGGVIAVAALFAGVVAYRSNCNPALHMAARNGDTMGWLRDEFHLDHQQFAMIERMHRDYSVVCDIHCRTIRAALANRAALLKDPNRDPHDLARIDEQLRSVGAECEQALRRHLEQVAAVMSPEDGRCYLETVQPLIAKFDHSAVPNLDLTPNRPRHGNN